MSHKETKRTESVFASVYKFFYSIKLSISVLIALAATSIFGTVIQQGREYDAYANEYGAEIARLIWILNLDDMYHSWWFQFLLLLLLINITVCSLRRLPHAIRLMRDKEPEFDSRPAAIHEKWEKKIRRGSPDKASAVLETVLRERIAAPIRKEVNGKIYFLASKGAWSRMGVYATHSSLFLFAVGALIGAEWGFKGFVQIPEGETVSRVTTRAGEVRELEFSVRCDAFQMEYYPDGRVKEYLSDLTVTELGKEVIRRRIEVNSPLIHRGIYFYQSSYGASGAWVTVFGPRRNIVVYRRYLPQRGRIDLEGGEQIVLWDFPNIRGRPSAQLALFQKGKDPIATAGVPGTRRTLGGYEVQIEQLKMYTGLQVAKDPGVPVVWAGCLLITLGCLTAFFASHKRVWARVETDANGVVVFLGGNASRNRLSFGRWFGDVCEYAQESFEKAGVS